MKLARSALLAGTALAIGCGVTPVRAQTTEGQLGAIEGQIRALQGELRRMKQSMAAHDAEVRAMREEAARTSAAARTGAVNAAGVPPAVQIPPGYALVPASPGSTPGTVSLAGIELPKMPSGTFKLRGITVTLGGFIEEAGIFRTRNEVADIGSDLNTGIPLANSPLYHENELRFTARASRISLDAKATPDPVTLLDAYYESDWQGAGVTSNSKQTNSYVLRIRHLYARYDRSDWGLDFLGGQTWSLLTMTKKGITGDANDNNIPLTIDTSYVAGFTFLRVPQFRVSKRFAHDQLWFAFSAESPQANFYSKSAAPITGTINLNNPGGQGLNSTTTYSDDVAPDLIVKAALDEPFGHFEAYGLGRFLHDRVSYVGTGTSSTVMSGGGGAAALLHVVPNLIDIQGSFLAGTGIGRYGAAQLPDAVVGVNGAPKPLPEVEGLVGIVAHPLPNIDLYGYGGTEQIDHRYFDAKVKGKLTAFGYGNPLYSNAGCGIELSPITCTGNTSGVEEGSVGGWWKFLHSADYGSMQLGFEYSYLHRSIFQGVGPTPKTDDNIMMLSFRYYPFVDTAPKGPPIY